MLSFGLILRNLTHYLISKVVDSHGHIHAEAGSHSGGQFVSAHQEISGQNFTNTEAGHFKFWKVGVHGAHVITHNGRIGTAGVIHIKTYPSSAHARAAVQAKTAEKLGKGYKSKGDTTIKGMMPVLPEVNAGGNNVSTNTSQAHTQTATQTLTPVAAQPAIQSPAPSNQPAPAEPHPSTPSSLQPLIAKVKEEAFNKGIRIEHGRVTGEGSGGSTEHFNALLAAKNAGMGDGALQSVSSSSTLAGRAAFKAFHKENPHAPDGMSRKEIVAAVREHHAKSVPTPNVVTPVVTPTITPTPAPNINQMAEAATAAAATHATAQATAKIKLKSIADAYYKRRHTEGSDFNENHPEVVQMKGEAINAGNEARAAGMSQPEINHISHDADVKWSANAPAIQKYKEALNNYWEHRTANEHSYNPSNAVSMAIKEKVMEHRDKVSALGLTPNDREKISNAIHDKWVAHAANAANAASQSSAQNSTQNSGASSDPHGLAALDTPSKIKNAVYDAEHKLLKASHAGQPIEELKAKRNAVMAHAIQHLNASTAQDMRNLAAHHVNEGSYKLPFKSRSRNAANLPQAAQTASQQAINSIPNAQPATPHVSEADQLVAANHAHAVAMTAAHAAQQAALAAQAAPVAAPVNPADPHNLAALDTPSKIKNAVYDATHKYHEAIKAGLPVTDYAARLQAVAVHASHKLGNANMLEMSNLAMQHVQEGKYKLPFKSRSRNASSLPVAAQTQAQQEPATITPSAQPPTTGLSGVEAQPVAAPVAAPAEVIPVVASVVPTVPQIDVPKVSNKALSVCGSGFDPVTHICSHYVPTSEAPIEHMRGFVAAHVQDVLSRFKQGLTADPNKIKFYSRVLRKNRLANSESSHGITLPLSMVTAAKSFAANALAKAKNEKAVKDAAAAVEQAAADKASAEAIANGTATPLEVATHELRIAAHQRGRNIAQYSHDSVNNPEYNQLRTKIEGLKEKVRSLSNYNHASDTENAGLAAGKAERSTEIIKENKVKTLLQEAAAKAGMDKTYGNGFMGTAVPEAQHTANHDAIAAKFNEAAAIVGHDKAKEMRDQFTEYGKTEGLKKLKAEATAKLTEAAKVVGNNLGYNGGFEGTPVSQEQHDKDNAHLNKITNHAAKILGEEAANTLRTTVGNAAISEGNAKVLKEKAEKALELAGHIETLATQKGYLSATGEELPLSTTAALEQNIARLNNLKSEMGSKAFAVAHAQGLAKGQKELTDTLAKASFALGHHAGKNTEPSNDVRMAAELAHAKVKKHMGLEAANEVAKKSYEEGKADALNPDMTEDKIDAQMKELGLHIKNTSDFRKSWVKHMPKVSPKEVLTAFLGKEGLTSENLSKLGSFSFGSDTFHMSSNGIQVHGSTATNMDRNFNFTTKQVEHSYLRIASEDQSKGAVRKIFNALMSKEPSGGCVYTRMGMKTAHVHGALDGGGYAWPKFGFYYDNADHAERHHKQVRANLKYRVNADGNSPQTFDALRDLVTASNSKLPNGDGTFSVRPYTEEDHAKYLKEHNVLNTLLNSNNTNTGWLITNANTPMMNAVHSRLIKAQLDNDKRPTIVKVLMRNTDMYGTIHLTDETQMTHIREYIGG